MVMPVVKNSNGSNPAMRSLIDQTLAGRKSVGPVPIRTESAAAGDDASPEHLLVTHAIEDGSGRFIGAMLVARNLGYLSHVQSTLNYSRKLSALGRLMAGVAHEVKNPLNAMTIHLELLKQKLEAHEAESAGRAANPAASPFMKMVLPRNSICVVNASRRPCWTTARAKDPIGTGRAGRRNTTWALGSVR